MVVGAGQMGIGIAQVAAEAGFLVLLNDKDAGAVRQGISTISNKELLSRIIPVDDLQRAREADVVVEAVVEKMEVKRDIFQALDRICPSHTILASNTSSLSITEIAACTGCPERVIGMHFMNPAPKIALVEVIRGLATSDHTFRVVESLIHQMGKVAVQSDDVPGFIANRILIPMINEAIYCVYEGVAAVESVDQVFKLGMHHPMGPLKLADWIGLDTCLYIMETLHAQLGDSKYRPCPLLRKYVKAGRLGKKSGRGFYEYSANERKR